MTYDPTPPQDPRGGRPPGSGWGTIGLFVVGVVIVLALLLAVLDPSGTQQADNAPTSPPPSAEPGPPPTPAPAQ